MALSAKELFTAAQHGPNIEARLALLAPVEHVQPRDESWAEAMASLAWMYRATNNDEHALRCANFVASTQPRGLVWREHCVVLRNEIANRTGGTVDRLELIEAIQVLVSSNELAAAYEGALTLADVFCEATQFVEAEHFAREALSYAQRMRRDNMFDGYCFPAVVGRYQSLAWIQAAAGQHEAARATLQLALDELAQPAKLGSGGTLELLRRRVQERLDALPPRAQ